MHELMMIGFGSIGQIVYEKLPKNIRLKWIVVPKSSIVKVKSILNLNSDIEVIHSIDQCSGKPDFVVEVAGQLALKEHLIPVLNQGWRVGIISVGALADADFYNKVKIAAYTHHAELQILSGAVAGIDGIAAAKEGNIKKVTYQGLKNPDSWRGSYAEQLVDLNNIDRPIVFFKGSAREAALKFPANANVAATVALSSLGMDSTMVELIADPTVRNNRHSIMVVGDFGEMQIQIAGNPLSSNPKTSTLAALSVLYACRKAMDYIKI